MHIIDDVVSACMGVYPGGHEQSYPTELELHIELLEHINSLINEQ